MKVLRIFTAFALVLSVVFTFAVGRYKISGNANQKQPEEYKGIITVWHVDSFEGGTGSRKQFLLKAARTFEKKYDGVLVMVSDYTAEGLKTNFEQGIYPDAISFGLGVEVKGFGEITLEKEVDGGKVGGKTFATAWCRGGYVLIANPELVSSFNEEIDDLLVSQGEYTQPVTALMIEGVRVKKAEIKKPMDAYVKFVQGKTPYFLGTQRDINRLSNRGMEVISKPLTEYNDLYQYIVVTGKDQLKRFYAEEFINHLISEEVQKSLKNIGMLSPFYNVEQENEHLTSMQNLDGFSTVSAFTAPSLLKEMQSISLDFINGDQTALNKIKNMLV